MPKSFDTAKYMAMPEAEAEAYMAAAKGGGEAQDAGGEAEAQIPAEQDADAQTEGQEAQEPTGQGQGEEAAEAQQRMVPHGALHEERMKRREAEATHAETRARAAQLEARIAQLEQQGVSSGQQQQEQEYQDETGQELMFEDPAAIDYRVQQALAPYLGDLQELQQLKAEKVERQALEGLAAKYGDQGAADMVMRFDAAVPQLKAQGRSLEERYFMAKGVHAMSPDAQAEAEAKIQAGSRSMAVDQKAKELASRSSSQASPNLSGIAPAAANGPTQDYASMSAKDMLNAPQGKLDEMRRGRNG